VDIIFGWLITTDSSLSLASLFILQIRYNSCGVNRNPVAAHERKGKKRKGLLAAGNV